jgi:hypothetical protein
MSNPIFDSKYTRALELQTPAGTLYYAIYYDYDELNEVPFVNYIDLTLPDGSVIPLPPSKYKELYYLEEENLNTKLL